MKVYMRIEDGIATTVSVKDALAEVNHAMMAGRKDVREMSSGFGRHSIQYKDGRNVRLTETDAQVEPKEAMAETAENIRTMAAQMALYADLLRQPTAPDAWSTASHRTLLHRFTSADKDGRALCNKSFRPHRYGNGYSFATKAEREADRYAYLYTFCPKCEAK